MSIEISAELLTKWICFSYDFGGIFSMECNHCSNGDYMFFRGTPIEATTSDWLSKAAIHVTNNHPDGE